MRKTEKENLYARSSRNNASGLKKLKRCRSWDLKKIIPSDGEAYDLFNAKELTAPEILLKRFGLEKNLQTKIEVWSKIGGIENNLDTTFEKIKQVGNSIKILRKSNVFKEVLSTVASFNTKMGLFDSRNGS